MLCIDLSRCRRSMAVFAHKRVASPRFCAIKCACLYSRPRSLVRALVVVGGVVGAAASSFTTTRCVRSFPSRHIAQLGELRNTVAGAQQQLETQLRQTKESLSGLLDKQQGQQKESLAALADSVADATHRCASLFVTAAAATCILFYVVLYPSTYRCVRCRALSLPVVCRRGAAVLFTNRGCVCRLFVCVCL